MRVNQNQNQINGMKSVWTSPGIHVLKAFTGHEPGIHALGHSPASQ